MQALDLAVSVVEVFCQCLDAQVVKGLISHFFGLEQITSNVYALSADGWDVGQSAEFADVLRISTMKSDGSSLLEFLYGGGFLEFRSSKVNFMMKFLPNKAKRSELSISEVVNRPVGLPIEIVLKNVVDYIISPLSFLCTEL